jgi:hypothetical protein
MDSPPAAPKTGKVAAGGRKRVRAVDGIARFKDIMFTGVSADGEGAVATTALARFHAMAQRHPTINHGLEPLVRHRDDDGRLIEVAPPAPVPDAQVAAASAVVLPPEASDADAQRARRKEQLRKAFYADDDAATVAAEADEADAPPADRDGDGGAADEAAAASTRLARNTAATKKKLGALIALYYEWNHAVFRKLPIKDTLCLLKRVGRMKSAAPAAAFEAVQRRLYQADMGVATENAAQEAAYLARQARKKGPRGGGGGGGSASDDDDDDDGDGELVVAGLGDAAAPAPAVEPTDPERLMEELQREQQAFLAEEPVYGDDYDDDLYADMPFGDDE